MTLTVLRPNVDTKKVGVTHSTGSSAFALTDDSPDDDATYIRAVASLQYPNAYAHLGLTNLGAVSGSQRILRLRIRGRVRMHAADSGHGAHLNVRLWDHQAGLGIPGATKVEEQPANPIDDFTTASATTVQAKTGTWHNAPPVLDGAEWTKPVVDRLTLHLAWYYSVGSVHENLRATELYVDADVRDQPTVGSVVATGYDTSTRPAVTWAYTPNADGDPQTAYRVKVFSAAQYGAGGFDPETSASLWDSGERAGAAESLTVEQDLPIGVTAKAYVKGAQDFNGARWFSVWASSSAFTVATVPPAVPTLTVTGDATLPWLRNIIKVTSNANLLGYDDGTFETAASVGSWVNVTNATLAQTTAQAAHGSGALQLTAIAAANMEAATSGYPTRYRCKGSTSYTFLAQSRAAVTSRSFRVRVRWYDKAGTIIGSVVNGSSVANSAANFLAQSTLTATSPANATHMQPAVEVIAPAASEVHYVDKVSVSTSTSTTWTLPGLAPGGAGGAGAGSTIVEWSWATIGAGNLAHPQLWGGGDGFNRNADGFSATGTYSTVEYDPAERDHGQGSIRWDIRDTTSALYVGAPAGTFADPSPSYPLAAVPGRVYSFSLRAKASVSFSSQVNLQAIDAGGNAVGSPVNGGAISIGTGWAEWKVENFTIPAGAVWVRPQLDNAASVTERSVWVDRVQWVLGATVGTARNPSGQPTVWTPVRGAATGELPVADEDGVATVHDAEAPPGYTVTYRARNITLVADQVVASVDTAYVQTMLDPPGVWVLRSVATPVNAMQVTVPPDGLVESQHEEATTFYPLRPTTFQRFGMRPVVVSDFLGGLDGTLKVVCFTDDEWLGLRQLVHTAGTLWLVFPDFGARYIRVLDRGWPVEPYADGATKATRTVTLEFLEAGRPV